MVRDNDTKKTRVRRSERLAKKSKSSNEKKGSEEKFSQRVTRDTMIKENKISKRHAPGKGTSKKR